LESLLNIILIINGNDENYNRTVSIIESWEHWWCIMQNWWYSIRTLMIHYMGIRSMFQRAIYKKTNVCILYQCSYIALSMFVYCIINVRILYHQCLYTVSSMFAYCIINVRILYYQCLYTVSMFVYCIINVRILYWWYIIWG
jgi:hypothetical protein